jgi:hypothetical protein
LVDVALEVTTHRSGLTTEAWRIRVRDHNDLDETHILQPFRLPAMTLNWTEKAHGTKSRNPAPKTRYRIRVGGPFAAFADFAESLRLSERAVPTQEDATEIGQLFCEVLDRTSRATIVRSLVSANECHKWYECSSCQVYRPRKTASLERQDRLVRSWHDLLHAARCPVTSLMTPFWWMGSPCSGIIERSRFRSPLFKSTLDQRAVSSNLTSLNAILNRSLVAKIW